MSAQINPNNLPSGTSVYFLVVIISSFMIAFWSGQFLPGPEYFTTPFAAQFQPGLYSVASGFYGIVALIFVTAAYFFYHSHRQRRAFGPFDEISPQHPVWAKVKSLSEAMGVPIGRLLSDRDITNADAISFGFFGGRTILLGKRLLLMAAKRHPAFTARVAHELGHFKNGDVKYAVLSRALLQANVTLMIAILVWLCIRPARVVTMQYFLFISPAMGLPGASPELFFKLHGMRWATYWLNQVLGSLAMTAPIFAFWTLLLFFEYRSLLRTREILADAQAATWAGDEALLGTLNAGGKSAAASFRQRAYELFSPHPLVAERIKVVLEPEKVLNPGLLRFLFLGYLWSLTVFLISNIDLVISILNGGYGRLKSDTDVMAATLSALRFENVTVSLLYMTVVLAVGASYFIVIATLLRSCLSRRLAKQTTLQWLGATLLQIAFVTGGVLIGDAFHPYSQASQASLSSEVMLGQPLSGLFFSPISIATVTGQVGPFFILLAIAVLFWIEAAVILKGRRTRPVKLIEWVGMVTFTFLFVYQSYATAWASWLYPNLRNFGFFAWGTAPALAYLILASLSVRLISGSLSGFRPATYTPPWLLARTCP